MSVLRITARAPSNIAVVKYMGKKDPVLNLPTNSSISMTLNSLCTFVEVELSPIRSSQREPGSQIEWSVEPPTGRGGLSLPSLNEKGISRVVRHVERVQKALPAVFQSVGLEMRRSSSLSASRLRFRSANTFPASSGIASSASSFAAVTLATAAICAEDREAFQRAWEDQFQLRSGLAEISRQGSGSSCRSFFGPWVGWKEENATLVESSKTPPMAHFVILIKTEPKLVSSSEAHARVKTSPLWLNRTGRAEERALQVQESLKQGNLQELARLAWAEAWEMHSLFHTAQEPFTYWEPETVAALRWFDGFMHFCKVQNERRDAVSSPVVTLDAGPNIHVLVEKPRQDLWRQRLQEYFSQWAPAHLPAGTPSIQILEDEQGFGPEILRPEN